MARGKHKKRADIRNQAKKDEEERSLRDKIATAQKDRHKAEEQAVEVVSLVSEIEQLRRVLRESHSEEETDLRNEIKELAATLDEMKAREVLDSNEDKRMVAGILYDAFPKGTKLGPQVMESIFLEAEKRMSERHPDLFLAAQEDLTITDGVDNRAYKKLGKEGVRAIQRARGIR